MEAEEVAEGMTLAPDGFNAVNVYALSLDGVWLPALTMKVDTSEIIKGWAREPLRLAVGPSVCNFPD